MLESATCVSGPTSMRCNQVLVGHGTRGKRTLVKSTERDSTVSEHIDTSSFTKSQSPIEDNTVILDEFWQGERSVPAVSVPIGGKKIQR